MNMTTFTGLSVDPFNLDPLEISLTDIAQSLANQCRYNGHLPSFYSVAEHCVRVSDILYEEFDDARTALCGLLHDGCEAYLSDLPNPVKVRPELATFRELEDRALTVVCQRFNIPAPDESTEIWDRVWKVDHEILGWEAAEIRTGSTVGWDPVKARSRFIQTFHDLNEISTGEHEVVT